MKLREELRFSGKALSATVRRVADRWFVCVPVEVELPEPACENQAAVGIDLGVSPVIREARNSRGLAQQHFLRGRRNEPDAMAQHDAHGMASMALLAQLFARMLAVRPGADGNNHVLQIPHSQYRRFPRNPHCHHTRALSRKSSLLGYIRLLFAYSQGRCSGQARMPLTNGLFHFIMPS